MGGGWGGAVGKLEALGGCGEAGRTRGGAGRLWGLVEGLGELLVWDVGACKKDGGGTGLEYWGRLGRHWFGVLGVVGYTGEALVWDIGGDWARLAVVLGDRPAQEEAEAEALLSGGGGAD